MKRAGIYFFFDKDGIVDRYVPYFITGLHEVVDYIVVVVNGRLTAEGRKTLAEAADDLIVRENRGFDAWAYKEAIEYIGWDELREFDELVIANSTIYGPLYPFQEAFDRMDADPCDLWGMYLAYGDKKKKDWFGIPLPNGLQDHIASNFVVFKQSILHSYEFYHFCNDIPEIKDYFESGAYFEFPLTGEFSDAGFTWATLDEGAFRHVCPNPMVYGALQAVSEYRVPILRKKAFFDANGSIDFCTDIPRELMRYIEEHTEYDCGLIWENLLRTVNQYDLKNWFNLNQILPLDYSKPVQRGTKIAAIFHSSHEDRMGRYLHNIESFPDGTDLYFTTDTQDKLEVLKELLLPLNARFNIEYRLVENGGRDVSALLIGCKDVVLDGGHDLVCFMHDVDEAGDDDRFSCVSRAFSDCCFENVAASRDYVNNVVELFRKQEKLGLAVPPPPKNADRYRAIGGSWGNSENFSSVQKLLAGLELKVPLDPKRPPVSAYGSMLWFRPKALAPLFQREWCVEDLDKGAMYGDGKIPGTIVCCYGFVAQSQGYYTSYIMNRIYAEQEVTRMTDIAHTYVELTLQHVGAKAMLKIATADFLRMLQQKKVAGTPPPAKKPVSPAKRPASPVKQPLPPAVRRPRGRGKSFLRGICPIGLWNLLRRVRCAAAGGRYVEPSVERGPIKTVVRACMPRFLWDMLRKAKCKENGWIYVED